MNAKLKTEKNNPLRFMLRWSRIPLLVLLLMLLIGNTGHAQLVDSVNYKLAMGNFKGLAGDTVRCPIKLKNLLSIGAFMIRLEFDTTLLKPVYVGTDAATVVFDSLELVGRGLGTIHIDSTSGSPPWETDYTVFARYDSLKPYPNQKAMFISFFPPYPPDTTEYIRNLWGSPRLTPETSDPSTILNLLFQVKSTATLGQVGYLYIKNSQDEPREVQLSDTTGLIYIQPGYGYPQFAYCTFTVGEPDNSSPVISVSPDSYNVTAGQPVSFNVNVTDADGDDVTLTGSGIPTGASFSPATNAATPLTQAFSWTPTSTDNGTYSITFTADDGISSPGTKTVTIIVGGTTVNNPVITVQTSFALTQGELLTFTASATDPNGDNLCLKALSLPAGAKFGTADSVCGTGSVSGQFIWTPSFSQKGDFAVTFMAVDATSLTTTKTVNIYVEEIDRDRLYSSSSYGQSPVGGIAGATPVVFPIDLATTKTVYGVNFRMKYPGSVAQLDSINVTDRIPEYVVWETIGQVPDTVNVITYGLASEPVVEGSSTAILNAFFSMDSLAEPGNYWIHLFDAWEAVSPSYQDSSLPLVVDSGIIQVDRMGDVTLEGRIDVADATSVVSHILGHHTLPYRNFATANVITDSIVNVVDLVAITYLVLGLDFTPPSPAPAGSQMATIDIEYDDLMSGQLTKLNVRGEFPDAVAGIELQIDYDPAAIELDRPEMAAEVDNFILDYNDDGNGRLKVLLFTFQPWKTSSTIPAGLSDIIRIPALTKKEIKSDDISKVRITRAYLSNPSARDIPIEGINPLLPTTFTLNQNYPNPFNPTTKIDFEIGQSDYSQQHVRLEVYNILGRKVRTLVDDDMTTGSYSVIWDATDGDGTRVATGIYLYRLEVGDKSQSKKMLLLK
nr:T9SS type A sorting domain-containing protein [candidate division Zixibacteria bacterium]